jgi:hypothetical protein
MKDDPAPYSKHSAPMSSFPVGPEGSEPQDPAVPKVETFWGGNGCPSTHDGCRCRLLELACGDVSLCGSGRIRQGKFAEFAQIEFSCAEVRQLIDMQELVGLRFP